MVLEQNQRDIIQNKCQKSGVTSGTKSFPAKDDLKVSSLWSKLNFKDDLIWKGNFYPLLLSIGRINPSIACMIKKLMK